MEKKPDAVTVGKHPDPRKDEKKAVTLSRVDLETIVDLYKTGRSAKAVARHFGITPSELAGAMRRMRGREPGVQAGLEPARAETRGVDKELQRKGAAGDRADPSRAEAGLDGHGDVVRIPRGDRPEKRGRSSNG